MIAIMTPEAFEKLKAEKTKLCNLYEQSQATLSRSNNELWMALAGTYVWWKSAGGTLKNV